MTESPVLLVGFNRPDNLQKVFDQIRKNRPQRLYVAIDGPRQDNEHDRIKCEECRQIIKQVDWDCDLHTLFRDNNLGCGHGMYNAISWAFENENKLIILEDDCVPTDSFFSYCDLMLEKYKDDTRVWQVAGRSYHPNSIFFNHSDYIFSHFPHVWGWATWKRCWSKYDFYISDYPQFFALGGAINSSVNKRIGEKENCYFRRIFDEIQSTGTFHAWGPQWSYLMSKNDAYSIVPHKNLIHNIGAVGTHTPKKSKPDIPSEEMSMDLKHPLFVIPNREYDLFHARKVVYPRPNYLKRWASKLKHLIIKIA